MYTLLLAVIVYFFLAGGWCKILLMEDGRLFRSTHEKNWLSKDGVEFTQLGETFDGHQEPLLQRGSSLYLARWVNDEPRLIIRQDLNTGRHEVLGELKEKTWVVGAYSRSLHPLGDKFYVMLASRDNHIYEIMEISPEGNREIPFAVRAYNFHLKHSELLHVSGVGDDMRFFVQVEKEIYRVTPMGEVEMVVEGKHFAAWNGRLLVFKKTGVALYRLTTSGPLELLFKKDGDLRKVRRRFGSVSMKKVMIRTSADYFIFDLENPGFQPVEMPYAPYYYLEKDKRLIVVWARAGQISIGEVIDGKAVIKEKWEPSLKRGWKIIMVFSSGVLVHNSKEHKTFLFDRM